MSEESILPLPEPVIQHHWPRIEQAMKQWRDRKRVPPVLLLTGPAGVGKREMAYFIAQTLLCERAGFAAAPPEEQDGLFGPSPGPSEPSRSDAPLRPCGECAACRRALHGNWVDFTEIRPEGSDAKDDEPVSAGVLKIDQFRELKSSQGFGAHEGSYRIILIPGADRMTPQAANSVLKLLEEPPRGWLFLLTASDPTLILPTVLSRCQSLRLAPFPSEAIVEILAQAGVSRERSQISARLAQGSWGKALALSSDETWEKRDEILAFLKDPQGSVNALVEWASQSPRHLELLIDQLEALSAELVRWSVSPELERPEKYGWINSDGSATLAQHASRVAARRGAAGARAFWTDRAARLARARRESLAPLNRKLLVQDLLLPWIEAQAR